MALTAPQEAIAVTLEAQIEVIEAAVAEIGTSVENSLSLRNMGAGFIMNMAIDMKPQLQKLKDQLAALRGA